MTMIIEMQELKMLGDQRSKMKTKNQVKKEISKRKTGPMDSDYEERGDKGHFEDKMNMGEGNQNKADDLEKERLGEDDSYVEESVCIIKNRKASENQNEVHNSLNKEVNNEDREDERGEAECITEIGEQPEKNVEKNGSWDALLDDATTADPKDESQLGPSRGLGLLVGSFNTQTKIIGAEPNPHGEEKSTANEDFNNLENATTDGSCSNTLDEESNSMDLNTEPVENFEDCGVVNSSCQDHRNKNRISTKVNKAKIGLASLKLKDVVHANNFKKSRRLHISQSMDQSTSKSCNSVSMELEMTKMVGSAVGFQLEGYDHLLRSESEGEGVSKNQK
ncbi:hypothetical protein L1887_22404 [Cichorium endivia]|nr:hypothetical protein L1887_22404 [Cichorium endivia]